MYHTIAFVFATRIKSGSPVDFEDKRLFIRDGDGGGDNWLFFLTKTSVERDGRIYTDPGKYFHCEIINLTPKMNCDETGIHSTAAHHGMRRAILLFVVFVSYNNIVLL